jgi:hypothetical protein
MVKTITEIGRALAVPPDDGSDMFLRNVVF